MNFSVFGSVIYITAFFSWDLSLTEKLEFKDIVFTIISQENLTHEQRALQLKNNIGKQINFSSKIYLTHIDLKHIGAWTVLPVLPLIWKKHKEKFSWLFFCTDETNVDAVKLKELLESFGPNVTFVGRGLYDKDPSIIHHFFSSSDFKYPLFSSGFALHYNLLEKLIDKYDKSNNIQRKMDFSIDASHELAMFVRANGNGSLLTHSSFFCINYEKNCATHVKNDFICDQKPVQIKKMYFAIKTCEKFHENRVPVILKTWAKRSYYLEFYSDVYDKTIPTVKLEVPNTEHGHCGKTRAILSEIQKKMKSNKHLEWAVICDDDTLFSTYRLQKLLGCYNSNDAIAIGERYGYNVFFNYGYNYLTGGSGVVLSKKAIKMFLDKTCDCPSASTPDDMFLLGICLHQLNITIIHIPLFHQARPNDYNKEYLMIGPPISFHKHWMIDPVQVYDDWFRVSDESNLRTEL